MIEDKDLGLKVGSEEEAYWQEIINQSLKDIENLNKLLKFQNAIVEMAQDKIKLESI